MVYKAKNSLETITEKKKCQYERSMYTIPNPLGIK